MNNSIFREFQYFIRRINAIRSGHNSGSDSIEDLEERFRRQIESGLVISDPDGQEIAMEVLLSNLSESEKRQHLVDLRRTGRCGFSLNKPEKVKKSSVSTNPQEDAEKALEMITEALNVCGVKAQKQPLSIKMLQAAYDMKDFNYRDKGDLKLLFVKTITLSGHIKKAKPDIMAREFNKILETKMG